MVADGQLTLSPSDTLKFRFELKKQIPSLLTLTNPGTQHVAFKVKTTSPKKYCVRPNTGLLAPGTSTEVQVIMQQQKEYPPDMNSCKDKFLVQSVAVASAAVDVATVFAGENSKEAVKEYKLRVAYVSPAPPPSPVLEEEPAPATAPTSAGKTTAAASPSWWGGSARTPAASPAAPSPSSAPPPSPAALKNAEAAAAGRQEAAAAPLQKELQELEQSAKHRKLAAEARSIGGKAETSSLGLATPAALPFTLLHILLTFIIAFCLGRYL